MHVFMMHMSLILDPDAYVHDARMCVACIYDPQSLTLNQADACMYDIYIYDPESRCVYA